MAAARLRQLAGPGFARSQAAGAAAAASVTLAHVVIAPAVGVGRVLIPSAFVVALIRTCAPDERSQDECVGEGQPLAHCQRGATVRVEGPGKEAARQRC